MNAGYRFGSGELLRNTWLHHTTAEGLLLRELAKKLEAGC